MTARRRNRRTTYQFAAVAAGALLTAALLLFQPILTTLGYDMDDLIAMVWQSPVSMNYPVEGTAEVHFIDVGQASSILIRGSDRTALIDGGESQNAQTVIGYLEALGVGKIDYFFGTHPHSDHMGGCREIMETVPTDTFIMTKLSKKSIPTTVTYQKLIGWLGDHKDTVTTMTGRVGDIFDLGSGLVLTILGPTKQYDDLNNTSLVIRMDFGETSFLFTGDMEEQSQEALLEAGKLAPVTVLSAPHHGSDTSLDTGFMNALSPEVAVISCGEGNDYGHPSPKTLELYDRRKIEAYRTDRQGTVSITTDGSKLTITTERN